MSGREVSARPWGIVYVTLTMGNLQIKGLFLNQSYWKHVPNGRSRIGRSGWRLQWDLYRPCGAKLDVTGALLEQPISSLHLFKIFEASYTAFGISVGQASLLFFLGCLFQDLTRSHRPAIRTVLSLKTLYINFSSNWLQVHISKPVNIN
jgi:hypothetical protein